MGWVWYVLVGDTSVLAIGTRNTLPNTASRKYGRLCVAGNCVHSVSKPDEENVHSVYKPDEENHLTDERHKSKER